LPLFVEVPVLTYLGFWIVSQIFSGTLALALPEDVGGVALWAHLGGFIAGAVLLAFCEIATARPLSRIR
jgi:membrane associated rhomboid family serine protease